MPMGWLKYKYNTSLDSPQRTEIHKELINKKLFLRRLYTEWYEYFQNQSNLLPKGKLLELGSGGGFIKNVIPDMISSDVIPLSFNDLTVNACDMPFENNEISGIFMIDTFHHIKDSKAFLDEAYRVLKPKGMIVMIEPANSIWGRFIYKNFHHEPFDTEGGWIIPSSGPLSDANGALPWIVFQRDFNKFKGLFPNFNIHPFKYHTPFSYLLSGGLSMKQLFPGFSYGFIRFLDNLFSRISRQISMFVTIVIEKKIN